jgi:hypothetical protein
MATRKRSRRRTRIRSPHRQPGWLIAGAVIVGVGTLTLLIVLALTTNVF